MSILSETCYWLRSTAMKAASRDRFYFAPLFRGEGPEPDFPRRGRSFGPQSLPDLQRVLAGDEPAIVECVAGCTNPYHPENRRGPRVLAVRDARYKLVIHFDPATPSARMDATAFKTSGMYELPKVDETQ